MVEPKKTSGSKGNRRASRPAQPGVDETPAAGGSELAAEDNPMFWGDASPQSAPPGGAQDANDERLKRDKPPHWG